MVIHSRVPGSGVVRTGCLLTALAWMSLAAAAADDRQAQHQGDQAVMADAAASGETEQDKGENQGMRCGGDGHAHHKAMMARKDYKLSTHDYSLTDTPLVDMNGRKTTLSTELNAGKPVIITFVFTTCTTICPVLSGTFTQLQRELGPDVDDVRMVSVSIDPEYDTPERLRAYAGLFSAGPQWQFLTGDLDDIVTVQKSFDVYRGNKMNHEPTILLRKTPDDPWIRLDGLASAADVAKEYRRMMAAN